MDALMGTVEELMLLAEVVEAGGFSAASARCGIPKSRLSRRIAKLEERLGVGLIRRDSRRFEVTEVGRQIYQQGQSIRDAAQSAITLANEYRGEPSGLLRVACPVALAAIVVSHVAASFVKSHPKVRLSLTTTTGAITALAERHDIVLHPSATPLQDSEMVARRLCTFHYILVATPEVAARAGHPKSPQDLAGQDVIGWDFLGRDGHLHLCGPNGATAEVRVSERLRSDNLMVVREAALDGQGIAPQSRLQCARDLSEGRLCVVTPGWGPPPIVLYAVYPSRRTLSSAGQSFIDVVSQAFSQHEF